MQIDTSIDCYEVLGLSPYADDAAVTRAFRKLAIKNHPDKHQKEEEEYWTKRFQPINEAYAILGDPDQRQKYDKSRFDQYADTASNCRRGSRPTPNTAPTSTDQSKGKSGSSFSQRRANARPSSSFYAHFFYDQYKPFNKKPFYAPSDKYSARQSSPKQPSSFQRRSARGQGYERRSSTSNRANEKKDNSGSFYHRGPLFKTSQPDGDEPMAQSTTGYVQPRRKGMAPDSEGQIASEQPHAPRGQPVSKQHPIPEQQPSPEQQSAASGPSFKIPEIFWFSEESVNSHPREALGARDRARYLARASAPTRSYRRSNPNKGTSVHDPILPRMVYATTFSGVRRRTGRLQYSPNWSLSFSDSGGTAAKPYVLDSSQNIRTNRIPKGRVKWPRVSIDRSTGHIDESTECTDELIEQFRGLSM